MRVAITGANRGIGLALVKKYKSAGAEVFALCRKASSELGELSGIVIVEDIDVTSREIISTLEKSIDGNSIDLFLNNAGILKSDSWNNLSLDEIEEQFRVNTLGPLNMIKNIESFLKRGAKIGVLTSRMGSIKDNTSGGMYGYRISKAAANAACKSVSVDFKEKGHPVAILHPGYVKTDMTSNNGNIEPEEAADGLYKVMDRLTLEDTGKFWHSNGDELPW